MPIDNGTRVDTGLFHAFHHGWTEKLARALNLGMPRHAVVLVALATASLVAEPTGAQELAAVYEHDFRGRPLPPELGWFNAEGGKFFHEEPQGLRISLPNTWSHPWGGVGFRTSFGFGGDFEVTTAFEILHAEQPPSGFGTGITLYLAMAEGPRGAGFCRILRPNGKHVLLCNQALLPPGKKQVQWPEKTFPCDETAGRLRLKREGTMLSYLWAPGISGGDFGELDRIEFSAGDVERVRLVGTTAQKPLQLDLRLLHLQIRSQTSTLQTAAATPGPPAHSAARLSLVLAILTALSAAAGVALWARRHQVSGLSASDSENAS